MAGIPEKNYEEMYHILDMHGSGLISQEDFIKRNSNIYEGIKIKNMQVEITGTTEEDKTASVEYRTSFDTAAGTIQFENEMVFMKEEDRYALEWNDSLIFPSLEATEKVKVASSRAERGEISDRNGQVLAGKGTASSVEIVPGKLEDRVVNDPHGTGHGACRYDMVLPGKTGTAEIKASQEDTFGTELGWFVLFTTEENDRKPVIMVSMVEDVKEIGGSGYVVKKHKKVLDEYLKLPASHTARSNTSTADGSPLLTDRQEGDGQK